MDFWAPLPLVCILCKQVPFCVDLISFSPRTFRCFTNLHLWTHWSAKFERLFSLQHVFSIRQNHPKTSNIYFPSPEVGYQEFCELSGISYDVKVMWKCDEIKHGGKPEEHTWRPPLFLQAGSHHSWKFHFYVKCQSLSHPVPFQIGAPGKTIWQPSRLVCMELPLEDVQDLLVRPLLREVIS